MEPKERGRLTNLYLVSRLDLDPAQEGLEVVENRASCLQESVEEEINLSCLLSSS